MITNKTSEKTTEAESQEIYADFLIWQGRTISITASENHILSVLIGGKRPAGIRRNLLTEALKKELEKYFDGQEKYDFLKFNYHFEGDNKAKKVYQELSKQSKVLTYKRLAQICEISSPRHIGRMMAHNVHHICVPCHLVILSSGKIGNYSAGGSEIKALLIELSQRNR